jgi:hypothetical protein
MLLSTTWVVANFYGQIGFATIADDISPSHLWERLNAGRIKYSQLVILKRPENLTKRGDDLVRPDSVSNGR